MGCSETSYCWVKAQLGSSVLLLLREYHLQAYSKTLCLSLLLWAVDSHFLKCFLAVQVAKLWVIWGRLLKSPQTSWKGWLVVIGRGSCNYWQKVRHMQVVLETGQHAMLAHQFPVVLSTRCCFLSVRMHIRGLSLTYSISPFSNYSSGAPIIRQICRILITSSSRTS